MTDIRHEWDERIKDWPTIRKIAGDLGLTIHPHPTLSETLGEAAESAFGTTIHLAPAKR